MKNSLATLMAILVCTSVFSQKAESNRLAFDGSKGSTKVSGVSNKINFGSAIAKLSQTSDILFYGVPKRIVPKSTSQIVAANLTQRQKETPVVVEQRKVEEPAPQVEPPQRQQEVPATVEQKKVDEPTRQVETPQQTTQTNSTSSNPAPPVPSLSSESPAAMAATTIAAAKAIGAPKLGGEFTMVVPRFVALVIGVSNYKYAGDGGPRNLDNAANDADKLYKTLMTKYNFDTAASKYLRDPNRQQILDAFDRLTGETEEKDNVLVFYAGHGNYDAHTGFGYWLPADSKTSTRSAWIANSTIKDYMTAIKSKHTLLITDACFGGSIFKSRAVDAATFLKVHELYKDPSKRAMTSGNLSEVPDKSIFIDQLLKKLNENELDYLPSAKLFNLIYQPVADNATEPQFGVIQGAGDEGGDFIFIKKN